MRDSAASSCTSALAILDDLDQLHGNMSLFQSIPIFFSKMLMRGSGRREIPTGGDEPGDSGAGGEAKADLVRQTLGASGVEKANNGRRGKEFQRLVLGAAAP